MISLLVIKKAVHCARKKFHSVLLSMLLWLNQLELPVLEVIRKVC